MLNKPPSILTDEQRRYISANSANKTIVELATELGVKYPVIHTYITGKKLPFKKIKSSNGKNVTSYEVKGFFCSDNYAKIAII